MKGGRSGGKEGKREDMHWPFRIIIYSTPPPLLSLSLPPLFPSLLPPLFPPPPPLPPPPPPPRSRERGVSDRLYHEAFEPMLLVGLFAPGEQCSAAGALGMLYYFILAVRPPSLPPSLRFSRRLSLHLILPPLPPPLPPALSTKPISTSSGSGGRWVSLFSLHGLRRLRR